jgi:hypothetical protein
MALEILRMVTSKNVDPHAVFDDLEIRADDVFAKTQAGVDEVRRQSDSAIPPKLRTVLMLIDGRTPFESFRTTLKTYGDVTQLFSILRDLGLIVRTSGTDYARERNRTSYAPARSEPPPPQYQSPIDAITQMPEMKARIAQTEREPSGYSVRAEEPRRSSAPPEPAPRQSAPEVQRDRDIDATKTAMIRDVSMILGADAGPVIAKIQSCNTRDDLFASMMGIKKIISIYADRNAAEKFAARYQALSF